MENLYFGVLAAGLLLGSVIDWIKRLIPLALLGIIGIAGIILHLWEESLLDYQRIYSLIPGILLLVFSMATRESIGYGDCLIVLLMGLYMNIDVLAAVFMTAITLAGIVALVMILVFKKKKNYELPFVPFLLIGYVSVFLIGGR